MAVLVLILIWFLTPLKTQNVVVNNVEQKKVVRIDIASVIKHNVLRVYHSNMNDKREQIVNLLRRLHDYEDPGNFLEQNSYIHEYIFNRDCIGGR